jgi:hypothetical protein
LSARQGPLALRVHGATVSYVTLLSARQQAELVRMHCTGEYTIADLMEVFSVGRATVYRTLGRAGRAGSEEGG